MKKLPLSKVKKRIGKKKVSYHYNASFGVCSLTGGRSKKNLTADSPKEIQSLYEEWYLFYHTNGKTLLNRDEFNLLKSDEIQTFDDLISLWLENLNIKPATVNGYRSRARRHISPYIGKHKINKLELNDLQRVVDKITKELALKCDIWERVIYDYANLFKFGAKRKLIPDNLMLKVDYDIKKTKKYLDSLKLETDDDETIKVYDEGQLKKIFMTVDDYSKNNSYQAPCFAIYIKMLIYSGFRPSEALAVTWDDVNFKQNTIRINKTVTDDDKSIGSPKNPSSKRTVRMSVSFMKELLKFKHSQQLLYWQVTGKNTKPKYVFTNMKTIVQQKGKEWYTAKNFRNIWKGICKRHDIPYFAGSPLHCFRHTHATTQLLNSKHSYEVKFKIVSKRLGHSSVHETIKTYHHLFPEQKSSFDEDFDLDMDELVRVKGTG